MKPGEYHLLAARPWGYTPVYGVQINGQQEEGLWKPIGPMLPSKLTIGTLMLKHVCGPKDHLPVLQAHLPWLIILGKLKIWMLMVEEVWDGCKSITWFITTAKITRDSLKVDLVNAGFLDSLECGISKFKINLIFLNNLCVFKTPLKYGWIWVSSIWFYFACLNG